MEQSEKHSPGMEELLEGRFSLTKESLHGLSRKEFLLLADSCEHAGRFEDMILILLTYIESCSHPVKMEDEERTLLSLAFKGIVKPLREANISLTEVLKIESTAENVKKNLLVVRERVLHELYSTCEAFIHLVESNVLLETAFQDADAIIWAYKTVGDHRRYEAELLLDTSTSPSSPTSAQSSISTAKYNSKEARERAQTAFSEGWGEAQTRLKPTSILRLSLALNFAMFCYEIEKDENKAKEIAQDALDAAETEMTSLSSSDTHLPDTEHIIRILRQTLSQWNKS